MENKLRSLFEYQKFEGNAKLAALIADTESRFGSEISDDDLFMVSAAGELSDDVTGRQTGAGHDDK